MPLDYRSADDEQQISTNTGSQDAESTFLERKLVTAVVFEASLIIVAHPDDDILWLGSVIDKVGGITFCFQEDAANPEIGAAREKTINAYPLQDVSSLELTEPPSWDKANWSHPEATAYGIKLEKCQNAELRYRETYENLLHTLRVRMADIKNVFTHNPWGEYGHESHVLVYRVLKTLQAEFHYDLWFSNYSSNRSVNFMNHYIYGFSAEYECLPVNLSLVNEIAEIYKKNGCWTWYEDYQWFERDCLMREIPGGAVSGQSAYGHIFPVNYIKIHVETHNPKHNRFLRIATRLQRKLKRNYSPPSA